MNEDRRKELIERTVYCKGFPLDCELNDIIEFFNQFKGLESVIRRCWHDKASKEWKFKGSVFAYFQTKELADEFLKLESVKFKEDELIKKWQSDYIEDKRKERLEACAKNLKNSKNQNKKKDENKKEDGSDAENDDEEEKNEGFPTGTVVELTGLDKTIKWESIKERIEEMGLPVAFIEYIPGNEVAFVRLTNKDSAPELEKLLADDENKLKIGEKELSLRVVVGEEEAKFLEKQKAAMLKKMNATMKKKNKNKKGRGAGGGGKGRKGKWDNKKRRNISPSDQPPTKMKPPANDD